MEENWGGNRAKIGGKWWEKGKMGRNEVENGGKCGKMGENPGKTVGKHRKKVGKTLFFPVYP